VFGVTKSYPISIALSQKYCIFVTKLEVMTKTVPLRILNLLLKNWRRVKFSFQTISQYVASLMQFGRDCVGYVWSANSIGLPRGYTMSRFATNGMKLSY
jgi:hypothetical protein